jgi:hypothetical protein
MRVDRVATATESVSIAVCREYIEDIPDTINQSFITTVAPIFIELIGNMAKQLKRLRLSPLEEGIKA